MKRRKMYTGNEGRILSKEEVANGVNNHALLHSGDSDYLKFEFIGKEIFERLLSVHGCVGLRTYPLNDGTGGVVHIPVDAKGNELPVDENNGLKDGPPQQGGGGSGVRCPPSCG